MAADILAFSGETSHLANSSWSHRRQPLSCFN